MPKQARLDRKSPRQYWDWQVSVMMDADGAGGDTFGGGGGFASSGDEAGDTQKPRALPLDLPKSLDDRRRPTGFVPETELYDGWQGESQIL